MARDGKNLSPLRLGKTAKRRKLRKEKKLKKLKLDADTAIAISNQESISQRHESTKGLKPLKPKDVSHSSFKTGGKNKQNKLKPQKGKKETLLDENNEEDRTIHTLERLLQINGKANRKKMPTAFALDGLDYLLDVVADGDQLLADEEFDIADHGNSDGSDDMPVEIKHNKVKFAATDSKDESSFQKSVSEDEDTPSDSENDGSELDDKEDCPKNEAAIKNESLFDDTHNQAADSAGKYVPPPQRTVNISDEASKKKERLKRQIKGLLNRLSEANIHSICKAIENIYLVNSRAIVTHALTELVLVQFDTADPIPERLITESAMVVAVLSNHIGQEIVAHFLEVTVKKLNDILKIDFYGEGKECNNIVQLICSLYQLNAVQKQIVIDIIAIFLDSFKEKDIELLVLMLKTVGFQLRKDDPITLKGIVEKISLKSHDLEPGETSRTKYMLEVLTAIKNNNVRKILGYDAETINNRRKKVSMLCSKETEVFPDVTFQDLVDADVKGRWWIVGSSWGGLPMLKGATLQEKGEVAVDSKLVKAAAKLRMNTDIRRKIFYSVMSSQDFLEAFEKVLQIGLNGRQMREVGHVLVECCQKERSFNPFYFHLLNKFCHHDKQFVMSLQCSFWDRFKLFENLSQQQTSNVATLLSKLVLSDAIPISCLKVVEYAEIEKPTVSFLRKVFTFIAKEAKSHSDIDKVFAKLSSDKYRPLKNGLRLFLQHFMLKDSEYMQNNSTIEDFLIRMDQRLDTQKTMFFNNDFK